MGNDQTTLRQKDFNRLQMSRYLQISAQHNKKLYYKSLKPYKEFLSIIKSIHVRSTYLKYEWSVWLCQELAKNPEKLYQQYCDNFKLSIMKKSQNLEYFQPKCLSQKFFSSFENTTIKYLTTTLTNNDMESLFQEVKCYFMVLNWFLELPLNNPTQHYKATLSYHESSKENINSQKLTQFSLLKKGDTVEIDNQRQKIYRTLLKLTERYFDNNYFERELSNEIQQTHSSKLNPIRRFSQKQASLIKLIARQSNFRQRQLFISSLLDLLFQKYQNAIQKLQPQKIDHIKINALVQILGIKKVYCVLKIISEVGAIQQVQKVSLVLKFILQHLIIQNNQRIHNNQTITTKSPEKKTKSNIKIKRQSIR